MTGAKSPILLPKGLRPTARTRWVHLLAEKEFSDAHVVRKMIELFRACGRELCEAFDGYQNAYGKERMTYENTVCRQ